MVEITKGRYRHTHIMFNAYCFSTGTMVTRTHLSVMLYVHCLSCSEVVVVVVMMMMI
jgi:hypothetical protein